MAYNDGASEVLCVHDFRLPASEVNSHEHAIRKLQLNLSFVDQLASEQTYQLYKVPDCYILIYCPPKDSSTVIHQDDCDKILEWVQHKYQKMKDWLIIFPFECGSMMDFDQRKILRRFSALKQSLFRQNNATTDIIDQEKRDRSILYLL